MLDKKVFADELSDMLRDKRTFGSAFGALCDQFKVPYTERSALAKEMGSTLAKRPRKKPRRTTSIFTFTHGYKDGTLIITEQYSGIEFWFRKDDKGGAVMTASNGQALPSKRMQSHAQAHANEVTKKMKPTTRMDIYKSARIVIGSDTVKVTACDHRMITFRYAEWEFVFEQGSGGSSRTRDAYIGKAKKPTKKPSPENLRALRKVATRYLRDTHTLELKF